MCRLYGIVCLLFRTRPIFPRINGPNVLGRFVSFWVDGDWKMAQSAYNGSLGGEISRGEWVDRVFCHSLLRSLHLARLQVGTTHHLCSSTQLSSSNTVHSIGHESYEVQL